METKICRICGIEKNINQFRVCNNRYRTECKDCEKEYNKRYQKQHGKEVYERRKEKAKLYREEHKEYNKQYMKQYYAKNKDNEHYIKVRKEYLKNYIRPEDSKEKHRQKTKEWREKNREHIREYSRNYDNEHREEKRIRDREWRKNNPNKVREMQKKDSERRKSNPTLKVELQLRNMLNTAFKRRGYVKNDKLKNIVGMTSKEMVEYLLNTFKNNYGYEWDGKEKVHIDHINPLKNCKNIEEVYKACHYTNLQLLKASDNLSKGAKTDWNLTVY